MNGLIIENTADCVTELVEITYAYYHLIYRIVEDTICSDAERLCMSRVRAPFNFFLLWILFASNIYQI